MELTLVRIDRNDKSTLGALYIEDKYYCFTCEDAKQDVKIAGKTRIPSGKREVKFREVLSEKTMRYRERYDWFTWHLELQDVPDFEYVYIHIGNTAEDSKGCILLGNTSSQTDKGWMIGNSTVTFKDFYLKVSQALNNGEKVFINIVNLGGE